MSGGNPNHDPKNGEFTTGPSPDSSSWPKTAAEFEKKFGRGPATDSEVEFYHRRSSRLRETAKFVGGVAASVAAGAAVHLAVRGAFAVAPVVVGAVRGASKTARESSMKNVTSAQHATKTADHFDLDKAFQSAMASGKSRIDSAVARSNLRDIQRAGRVLAPRTSVPRAGGR